MNKLLAKLLGLPDGTNITFDPNNNLLLQSLLTDNNGNQNMLKFIVDKNEPFIRQRIYNK